MIFVFAEDGTMEVVDSLAKAQQYEPFDVENGVFVFYDEDGTWLRPNFTTPNRRSFFGLVVAQGTFELRRSAELDVGIDPWEIAVKEAVVLEPNRHFRSLKDVSQYVAAKRATPPPGLGE